MLRFALLIALTMVVACGTDSPCGVSWDGAEPELGTMVLSDGTTLSNGSWGDTRINAGTLTLDVRAMGDQTTLGDALTAGEMPVCRTLDDQNDQVIYQDNGPWITNSSHTGTLAITEFSDEAVKGQFTVTLKSTTGDTRELSGAFHVAPVR
jgi:hypothetical protein